MKTALALALLAAWPGLWSGLAQAQEPVPPPPVREHQGVRYVTGGVGEGERAAMLALAPQFNLKITFAERGGAYLADVVVRIADRKGGDVLQLAGAGPLLLAQLPPGDYRLHATALGREEVRDITVASTARSLVLRW